MKIRAAKSGDAAAIARIQNPIIRDTPFTFSSRERSTEETEAAIRELPCFVVATGSSGLSGLASYTQF